MRKLALLLLLTITSISAYSVEVNNLYRAKVDVSSQSGSARKQAIQKAFQSVIVKVSGQTSIIEQDIFKRAVKQYSQYLVQYSYERDANDLKLVARFDEERVNQLFLTSNNALWGNLRPQVVIWLVEESGFERSLISESHDSVLPDAIKDFSDNRGLPIALPLVDIEDTENVDLIDIWGRFTRPIVYASERYNAEAVVVMRLSNSSLLPTKEELTDCQPLCGNVQQEYMLDWSLLSGTSQKTSYFGNKYQGSEPNQLIHKALDEIVQVLLKDYALESQLNNEFVMDVNNINSLASYVEITEFLTSMSSVQEMMLLRAEGESRRFKLTLLGSKQAFLSSLKLNNQLQQFVDPLAPVDESQIPVFYWKN